MKIWLLTSFPYIEPITMQYSQAVHCDWLNIWTAGAPEIQKNLNGVGYRLQNRK